MTTREDIETRLLQAVAVEPSEDALRWLDQRVAQRVAHGPAQPTIARRGAPSWRTFLRPVAVLAALVLLTGVVVGAVSLLERLADRTPGWQTAYDQAEIIGLAQTDAGYTITLERAYGDLNQVIAFFTIESATGLEAPISSEGFGINHFSLNAANLVGPAGITPVSRTATAGLEPNLAAAGEAFQFDQVPASGTWELVISEIGFGASGPDCVSPCMDDETAGTWRYAFELPAPAGTVVAASASDTVGQATLQLTELRVSPTMITARIGMDVGGQTVSAWAAGPTAIRHLDEAYVVESGMALYEGDPRVGTGESLFFTTAGSDGVSGTWEIEISELDYQFADGEMSTVAGPWILTVTVP